MIVPEGRRKIMNYTSVLLAIVAKKWMNLLFQCGNKIVACTWRAKEQL